MKAKLSKCVISDLCMTMLQTKVTVTVTLYKLNNCCFNTHKETHYIIHIQHLLSLSTVTLLPVVNHSSKFYTCLWEM